MEERVIKIIEKVKDFVSKYEPKNVYREKYNNDGHSLYYCVVLFGKDDTVDLSFLIEFHKHNQKLLPIRCNTRKYNLHETINIESVEQAMNEFQPTQ